VWALRSMFNHPELMAVIRETGMSVKQLHQNVRAAEWKMSDDQVAEVEALL
jgi:hypothetical protein